MSENNDNNKNPELDVILNSINSVLGPITEQQKKQTKLQATRFYMFVALFISAIVMQIFAEDFEKSVHLDNNYVNVVRIPGIIMTGNPASPELVNPLLDKAFKDPDAKGVIIHINSPGGAPVASSEMRLKIKELISKYPEKEVITVGSEIMTSGAYMIASGTNTIYAHRSSVVGSIGVIIRAFGFQEIAEKVGLERRVIAAGDKKSGMDQWLPISDSQRHKYEKTLSTIHQQFISDVKEARGDKIDPDTNKDLFSGDTWVGEDALALGLIDGLHTLESASLEHFGTTTFRVYDPTKKDFKSIFGASARFLDPTPSSQDILAILEDAEQPKIMLMPY